MMDIKKINVEAGKLIDFLNLSDLKSDEKIAALKTAASTIENVLNCEMITTMMSRTLMNLVK